MRLNTKTIPGDQFLYAILGRTVHGDAIQHTFLATFDGAARSVAHKHVGTGGAIAFLYVFDREERAGWRQVAL